MLELCKSICSNTNGHKKLEVTLCHQRPVSSTKCSMYFNGPGAARKSHRYKPTKYSGPGVDAGLDYWFLPRGTAGAGSAIRSTLFYQ